MSPRFTGPLYWMDEESGVLAEAITFYLETNSPVTGARLAAIRAYFHQWVERGDWHLEPGQRIELLNWARALKGRLDIDLWLATAEALAMDPL